MAGMSLPLTIRGEKNTGSTWVGTPVSFKKELLVLLLDLGQVDIQDLLLDNDQENKYLLLPDQDIYNQHKDPLPQMLPVLPLRILPLPMRNKDNKNKERYHNENNP